MIWRYYRLNGRDLPWRRTRVPYRIVVSEIMLQQTQVSRVLKKYPEFIKAFPTFAVLARAPLPKLLRTWQGMGYNRRALALKKVAEPPSASFTSPKGVLTESKATEPTTSIPFELISCFPLINGPHPAENRRLFRSESGRVV